MARFALALSLSVLLPALAAAQPAQLDVKNVWTRASVGSAGNAAVFMTITSKVPDRLIAASTAAAKKTDLMTMAAAGGAMEMKHLKAIDIPANRPVSLNAGGLHVWLAGLKQPLKAGQSFPLTLSFEKAGRRAVTVSVIRAGAAAPMSSMGM
jgi:copper(I)-binding protein